MSVTIWKKGNPEQGLNIGGIQVYICFAEISENISKKERKLYADLEWIPQMGDDAVPAVVFTRIRKQAKMFLDKKGDGLSPATKSLLNTLIFQEFSDLYEGEDD